MAHDRTFCNKLLQCLNKDKNTSVQPDLGASLEHLTKKDIYQILELIHLSRDSQIQIKLIYVLTIYMMSNGAAGDIIIKYNPLYDKICEILTNGHQKKSNITLNFLASLLHTDDEGACTRGRALVLYAQNMIRVSGCLMAMSNLFINGLLHQDTWQALCRCVADTCSGLESNQNYCSHLIPVCVRRCRPGNEHVFHVVYSLLTNNERNAQLFYQSGGTSMFNREFLKYDRCLQLLNNVVSNPDIRDKILNDTNIVGDLQDLKQLYGATSQVGQWAALIFYTMNLKVSDFVKEIKDNQFLMSKEDIEANAIGDNVQHVPIVNSMNSDQMDDTSELLKNILTEVVNFKQRQNIYPNLINTPQSLSNKRARGRDADKCMENVNDSIYIKKIKNKTENISLLSFLMSNNAVKSLTNLNDVKDEDYSDKTIFSDKKVIVESAEKKNNSVSHCNKQQRKENMYESIIEFNPNYASTPKRTRANRSNHFTPRPIQKTYKRQYKNSIDSKLKIKEKYNKNESVQKRFGASRMLDVINETCSTIMKSVTNVFRSKKTGDSISECETSNTDIHKSEDANSFTDYMMRRDAVFERDNSYCNELMEEVQYECNTCNDTLSLKRKFSNDDFLKETVNKLKLGINLYGCNFRKISKTFWRDESYMTPLVLNNLYRKLILK